MPMPIMLAHKLAQRLSVGKQQIIDYLRPDGKTQVTVEYVDNKPVRVDTIVVSASTTPKRIMPRFSGMWWSMLSSRLCLQPCWMKRLVFNQPHRAFCGWRPAGGLWADRAQDHSGHLWRNARHGVGLFSGKDPTKVDRSAAYAARYVAKNIVAAE